MPIITFDSINAFSREFAELVLGLPWTEYHFILKVVFIMLTVFFFIGWLTILPRALEFRPRFTYKFKPDGKQEPPSFRVGDEWAIIMKKAEEAPPHSLTLSVIEADRLVDSVLQKMGLSGEHTADRLSHLDPEEIKSLDNLWKAHHARNELVHNPDYDIDPQDARRYLKYFEEFLKEIGAV